MAATAKRGDLRLIGIVLGENNSKVRNQEAMDLLDYGFNNVKMNCIMKKDTLVDEETIKMGNIKQIPLVLKDNLCVVEGREDSKKYDYNIIVNNIKLPIKSGDILGRIEVLDGNNTITIGQLITNTNVYKISFFDFFYQTLINLIYGII